MSKSLRFGVWDLVWLMVNVFVLGALVVLMVLTGVNGPRVLLAIGTIGMMAGKIGKALCEAKTQRPTPETELPPADSQRG